MPVNVLVFIHGITPEPHPVAHTAVYEAFWRGMQHKRPGLRTSINHVSYVEWGNRYPGGPVRPDTLLSDAERNAGELVRFGNVKKKLGPNNVLHPGLLGDWGTLPGMREIVLAPVREQLVQLGLADAIYYCSADGERAVRVATYGQVLETLRPHKHQADVRLHLVAHSLGVTVGHDLLYGLFGKKTEPDFLAQAESPEDRDDYVFWRNKVADGQLRVGCFVTMASQLPIFVLRKQSLVTRLAEGGVLDPSDIGIPRHGSLRWLVCYDIDDVLGFATRELYGNADCIRQVQVDAGDFPVGAHVGYWECDTVIAEAAALVDSNAI
jgi:hypothetical protein